MGQFFTASDGAKINYIDMGQGPVLLYVHAYGQNMVVKMPFFESLAPHFRVVSFDQRGWGETPVQGELSLDQSAKDTKDLIEYLGLKDVYFAGFSMGVSSLFAYVRQFGTRHLERIAMIDMTPCFINKEGWTHGLSQGWYTEETYRKYLGWMDAGNYRDFRLSFTYEITMPNNAANPRDFEPTEEKYKILQEAMKDLPGGVDALLDTPQELQPVFRAYWVSMSENDFRDVLPKIDKPMAIIYGRPGSIYDEATANYIASRVQKPELYPVDNNGTHRLMISHEAEVNQKLIDFGNRRF
ncbi:MAG: alpha/beta hydrolase [Treponema sp.]|nr:alpha/beta hydrolase [Treponema sp.]